MLNNKCEYCNGEMKDVFSNGDKFAFIIEKNLYLENESPKFYKDGKFEINYCPMCGMELTEYEL